MAPQPGVRMAELRAYLKRVMSELQEVARPTIRAGLEHREIERRIEAAIVELYQLEAARLASAPRLGIVFTGASTEDAPLIEHPPAEECTDSECLHCGARDCPYGEPLHYHHDGCPECERPCRNEEGSKTMKPMKLSLQIGGRTFQVERSDDETNVKFSNEAWDVLASAVSVGVEKLAKNPVVTEFVAGIVAGFAPPESDAQPRDESGN